MLKVGRILLARDVHVIEHMMFGGRVLPEDDPQKIPRPLARAGVVDAFRAASQRTTGSRRCSDLRHFQGVV